MIRFLPHLGQGSQAPEPTGIFVPAEVLSRLAPLVEESPELQSLAQETDPELFFESLLSYAGRLERRGSVAESQAVLQAVAEHGAPSQALRAHSRIQAVQGGGDVGSRAEFLLGRFLSEATEPSALFAMAGAGAIYRATRFALLSRLAASPVSALTRGFGARALASTLAFSAEATSFPLLSRAGHAVQGRTLDWSGRQVGHEIASSFLALGGLKLAGAAGIGLRRQLDPNQAHAWLGTAFQQTAMLGGIVGGHWLEEQVGLRPSVPGATTVIDSLALLLQFNVAGRLSQQVFGEGFRNWERRIDRQSEILGRRPLLAAEGLGSLGMPIHAMAMAGGPRSPLHDGIMMMEGGGNGGGRALEPATLRLPRFGLRGNRMNLAASEKLNREAGERILRTTDFQSLRDRLQDAGEVERLLNAFGVSGHGFDVQAFRDGYEIAQRRPERVASLAFDFDEVTLHWAFGPRDLLSVMARGAEGAYFHTPHRVLQYEPMAISEGMGLSRLERIWFQGAQNLLPMAFRQHIQFHPGMRAFQLGLRLGQQQNLMMVTVGPADRLMRLANEDPALKMIYFGRLPTEEISIEDVRHSTNIYTREDFVHALRAAESGSVRFARHPLIASYLETLRNNPEAGDRIKHPALALLRGKRPFNALVDDSAFALRVLGALPGFTVFQVPSARPSSTKNFTLFSTDSYLSRSANGYVSALAERLGAAEWSTGPVENRPAPEQYPYQRFSIEIPWTKFGAGYVALGREARIRGALVGSGQATALLASNDPNRQPLSLSETQTAAIVERLYREFDVLLDGRGGKVSIEARNTLMLRQMAESSVEEFQASLDTHFTAEEQQLLPQWGRPLEERGQKFYSRVASLIAAKTAVCNLLGLDVAEHAREIRFRFGRPQLTGTAAQRLNGNSMLTTLTDDGENGIGIALVEPGSWESGLVGIGVDLTTDRVNYTSPERHALAESAYKAVYPAMPYRQFNGRRATELTVDANGNYALTGAMMQAARSLRGDESLEEPLPIRTLHFQVGRATVALAAIPARRFAQRIPGFTPRPLDFPYRIDEEGRFRLPRPGMTVAVLGDVRARRTLDLVRDGHYVVHIERDPDNAELAQRWVESSGGSPESSSVIQADWYSSGANADLVEAHFPLHSGDLPARRSPARPAALRDFLDNALNSKLVNGGSGFVVSEVREIIEDLAETIQADPNLHLLDARYQLTRPPIVGGIAETMERERVHFLVYRKKNPGELP